VRSAGLVLLAIVASATATPGWTTLEPGLELGVFEAAERAPVGDSRITVLRIDPARWDLELVGVDEDAGSAPRTARDWCRAHDLAAAINAGMFAIDHATHVGYLRSRGRVRNGHVSRFESVAAFDPVAGAGQPRFRIFDLDDPAVSMADILASYASAVQNLRLVKRPGENRWSPQDRRWSEAALGEDAAGNVLFIFSRSPFTMHDLNRELLALDLDLVAAQHLEGGPEAQLFVSAGGRELEQFGSYETAFREDDGNMEAWPVPHALGIRRRIDAVQVPPETPRSREAIAAVRPRLEQRLAAMGARWGAPVFIRIFKETDELEVWIEQQDRFERFETYKICTYSGGLGPKERTGDQQAPEGFYAVTPRRMNPASRYHLSFDLGYPNAYDRSHGRTGSALMVHGDCVSIGCFAMTDAGIEEIWALADAALRGGQPACQVHVFPFRMTGETMLEHRDSRWYDFWQNLREGYESFERKGRPPAVEVRDGRYVFADS
jgi:hypothetical protein